MAEGLLQPLLLAPSGSHVPARLLRAARWALSASELPPATLADTTRGISAPCANARRVVAKAAVSEIALSAAIPASPERRILTDWPISPAAVQAPSLQFKRARRKLSQGGALRGDGTSGTREGERGRLPARLCRDARVRDIRRNRPAQPG
jgi:hypothetical protein